MVKIKIVVTSDGRGRGNVPEYILQQYGDAYAYIHCGDINADPGAFPRSMTVGGNDDIFYDYPGEQIPSIGTHRIFIVHSHQFMHSCRSQQLADATKEYSCDIVCYGYTRIATDETVDGIRLINPGSLW